VFKTRSIGSKVRKTWTFQPVSNSQRCSTIARNWGVGGVFIKVIKWTRLNGTNSRVCRVLSCLIFFRSTVLTNTLCVGVLAYRITRKPSRKRERTNMKCMPQQRQIIASTLSFIVKTNHRIKIKQKYMYIISRTWYEPEP